MLRRQAKQVLAAAGFDVLEAEDGTEALERLSSHPDISLVVSDLRMPKMDGMELLRRLHASGRVPALPFLMFTGEVGVEQIERARTLGAAGWLPKPLRAERLVASVQQLVKERRDL